MCACRWQDCRNDEVFEAIRKWIDYPAYPNTWWRASTPAPAVARCRLGDRSRTAKWCARRTGQDREAVYDETDQARERQSPRRDSEMFGERLLDGRDGHGSRVRAACRRSRWDFGQVIAAGPPGVVLEDPRVRKSLSGASKKGTQRHEQARQSELGDRAPFTVVREVSLAVGGQTACCWAPMRLQEPRCSTGSLAVIRVAGGKIGVFVETDTAHEISARGLAFWRG